MIVKILGDEFILIFYVVLILSEFFQIVLKF